MNGSHPIVGIHGAPRSGTSWLGQLFNSHPRVAYRFQPFFSFAFRDRVDERSDSADIGRMFSDLLETSDSFVHQVGSARLAQHLPAFAKRAATHIVYKEVRFHHLVPHFIEKMPRAKFIGIVRDPRAVLASWFKAPREFRSDWRPEEEWRHARLKNEGRLENWYGFERWKELSLLFIELSLRHPRQFCLIRYEELVESPQEVVERLFGFCGLSLDEQTVRFISESTGSDDGDPYGVFRKSLREPLQLPAGIAEAVERDLGSGPLSRFLSDRRRDR